MAMADAVLGTVQKQMKDAQKIATELSAVLNEVKLAERNVTETVTGTEKMKGGLKGVRDAAEETKVAMDLKLGGTAKVVADAAIQKRALNEIRDAAIEARIAETQVGRFTEAQAGGQGTGILRGFMAPGGYGQYEPGAAQSEPFLPPKRGFYQPPPRGFIGGPAATPLHPFYGPGGEMTDVAALAKAEEARLARVYTRAIGGMDRIQRVQDAFVGQALLAEQRRIVMDERLGRLPGGQIPGERATVGSEARKFYDYESPIGPEMPSATELRRMNLEAESALMAVRRAEQQAKHIERLAGVPSGFVPGFGGGAMMEQGGRFTREVPFGRSYYFDDQGRYIPTGAQTPKRARRGGDVSGAMDFLRRRGFEFDDAGNITGGGDGGGGDGGGRDGRGFFSGLLPGGRRASAGLVTTGVGLLAAAGPVLGAGAIGAAGVAANGLVTLVGAAATLKLAFADLSSKVFTNRQAFDALTPIQQRFVMTLRSVDEGLVKGLEGTAQRATLPGLTGALRDAITPASSAALNSGVGAFGTAIGHGATQLGQLFGSQQFSQQFGTMMKNDAAGVQDLFTVLTKLLDMFVRLTNAATPLTRWLGDEAIKLATWADKAVKAGQASGSLAGLFDKARVSLAVLGNLVEQVGALLGAFGSVVGFQNSVSVINLLGSALRVFTDLLNQNRSLFRDVFTGLVQAVNDAITAISGLVRDLHPLLSGVKAVADGFKNMTRQIGLAKDGLNLFRVVADAVVLVLTLKLAKGLLAVGTAAKAAETATVLGMGGINTLGITAATSAAKVGLLEKSLLLLKKIGVIAVVFDILANYLPQPSKGTPNPLKGVPPFGQVFGFGEATAQKYLGGGMPDTSKVPDVSAFKFFKSGGPKSITDSAIWESIVEGKLSPTQIMALRPDFADQQQYAVALQYASQIWGGQFSKMKPSGTIPGLGKAIAAAGAFASPPPIGGTKGEILPQRLITAINKSDFSGSVRQQIASRQTAITWIKAHENQYSGADLSNLFSEGSSLRSQVQTLQNQARGPARSGTGFLSQGRQDQLAAMQQAVAGSGIQGTSASALTAAGPQAVSSQMAALRALVKVEAEDYGILLRKTVPLKEHKALLAEQVALAKDLASNLKVLGALSTGEAQVQHRAAVTGRMAHILGIAGDGVPGISTLRERERKILLAEVHRMSRVAGHRAGVSSDPYSAIPGASHMTGKQLAHALQEHGVSIPKSTLDSLKKIHQVEDLALKEHVKLNSLISQNISARLSQINDTLKSVLGHPTNWRVPSEKHLLELAGLNHLPAGKRRHIGELLAAMAAGHGMLPTGAAALGIPLDAGGHAITVVHQSNTINVHGAEKDPKVIAYEIQHHLQQAARRNPTQTRGPNAGKNRGLT